MTNTSKSSAIEGYLKQFNPPSNPVLARLVKEHTERTDVIPCIGEEAAGFIYWLVRLIKAKEVVEFGSCIGYSTIVIGEAVKANGGHLTSIEIAKNHYREAVRNVREARLSDYVSIVNGDAKNEFEKMSGPFDFIMQDSLKALYPVMIGDCVEKLRAGGVMVADDTLFLPVGKAEKLAVPMDAYNKLIFGDSRLTSTIVPIGDGLTVSFKCESKS